MYNNQLEKCPPHLTSGDNPVNEWEVDDNYPGMHSKKLRYTPGFENKCMLQTHHDILPPIFGPSGKQCPSAYCKFNQWPWPWEQWWSWPWWWPEGLVSFHLECERTIVGQGIWTTLRLSTVWTIWPMLVSAVIVGCIPSFWPKWRHYYW